MRRLVAVAMAAAGCLGGAASAEPVKMSGPEILEAPSGHSVKGEWGSTGYTSSFDATGSTTYSAEGRPPAQGRWSVKGDQYCSVWEQSGESCYALERDGDIIIWIVPETGNRYRSTLVQGQP